MNQRITTNQSQVGDCKESRLYRRPSAANPLRMLFLLLAFTFFSAATYATVNLTIHNTGCQSMKVYWNNNGLEYYYATINQGGSWNTSSYSGHKWVYRHTSGSYLGGYTCSSSYTQSHNFDAGGCSGSGGGGGGTCNEQLAYWSLNACSAGTSYSEFTAATNSPAGFSSVTGSILSNSSSHSCTPSPDGKGICHAIRDYCSWADNDNNAYRFSVTLKPQTGYTAKLTKLSFNEAAPANYQWTTGGTGDNDPPSKYGVRVVVNGQEIFQQIDIPTTSSWSLEEIDFSNDPDFMVTSQTTFNFELLGYCRNGLMGYAVWDIDEVKVFGCSEGPCAAQGGDSDGDGVCNNQDCGPNDPAFPKPAGTACNDGNPNTVNDVIQTDGCTCAGTFNPCAAQGGDSDGDGVCNNQDCAPFDPAFPKPAGTPCSDGNPNTVNDVILADGCTCAGTFDPCAAQGGDSDGDGVCNNQDCAPFDPAFPKPAGTPCSDGNPNTVNDVIQADGCSCAGTLNPCAAQGGDSDGDGVCNNQDCAPFDPAFPKPAGTACNDGNPNTVNDVIQADGCSCAGTPVQVCDNITLGGTIGFGANCATSATVCNAAPPVIQNCVSPSGGSGNLEIIWLKATNNPNCYPPSTTITNISNDPYWSVIPGATGLTLNPGVVTENTCYLRCTRRAGCDTYLESNIISVHIDPACGGGGGTADCSNISITTGNGTITVSGLDGAPVTSLQVFDSNWQSKYNCFAGCPASETVNVTAGSYYVYVKYYTAGYVFVCEENQTVTVGGGGGGPVDNDGDGVPQGQDCNDNDPSVPANPGTACNDGNPNTTNDVIQANGCTCAGTPTGPVDNDGDGVPQGQDCNDNDPSVPATPGTACNDGNPNTTNDVIQANGCTCAGTPAGGGPNCDTGITITVGNGTITVSGLDGAPISSLQIFNSNWTQTLVNCFADCGASKTVAAPSGTYYVYAKYYTAGYQLICEKQATVTVTGSDPCANAGGDSDGDGVCNNQDCQPNNPAFPATPGTACNDGNPNTTNDMVQADGCSCAGTPVSTGCTSTSLVTYTMQACNSCSGGSDAVWTELSPTLTGNGGCNGLTATSLTPTISGSTHSCTPRGSGNALCFAADKPVRFTVTLPAGGNISGLSFYEQAPAQYLWSSTSNIGCSGSNSGTNNPPSKFDLKVYNGSTLVFSQTYNTQSSWNLRNVDFSGAQGFSVSNSTTFTFELKAYNTTGYGSVKAWDVDEITIYGCCSGNTNPCANQGGDSDGDGVCDYQDCKPNNPSYPAAPGSSCNDGNANTTNDKVQADGCTCAGTPSTGGNYCKIGDRVWNDSNGNGIHDTNEHGLSGVWVNLLDHLGNSLKWAVTDNDGNYSFDDMNPGDYKMKFSTPGGYTPTLQHQGNDPSKDSDIGYWTGMTGLFNVLAGQHFKDCDAGYKMGQYAFAPGELFNFDVVRNEEHASLYWIHNGGFHVERYLLERSSDGVNFDVKSDWISEGGEHSELYEDYDFEPLKGDNYYRIKLVNTNGSVQYSEVKKVNFPDLVDFTLFPNPGNDFVKINMESVIGKEVDILIFNNLGTRVMSFHQPEVYSKYLQMDVRDLNEGHYIVWINVPGRKPVAKTLVIGKL